jgi:RNA polymerase sigma-70 factor (ECF subfamily)
MRARKLDKSTMLAHQPVMTGYATFADRVRLSAAQLAEVGVSGLGALYDLTAERLVRFAVTVTRNQHDAEDAVQAVLARVADRPRLLASADCPWAYLLRMARNEALALARKKRHAWPLGNLSDLLTRRVVDEIEREEAHRAVWRALRSLPAVQAEVVVLKIWEDMTFAQIGQVLETSPHTAASRYQYAVKRLATKLADLRPDYQPVP